MAKAHLIPSLCITAVAALTLSGCNLPPHAQDIDVQPIAYHGQSRSLATDSDVITRYHLTTRTAATPWYHTRNDRGPVVSAGVRSPITTSAYTRTYDRVNTSGNGRVYDNYSQTTYRNRYIESTQ